MTENPKNEEAELIHKAFDAAKGKMEADIPNPTAGRKDTDAGKPGKDKAVPKPNSEEKTSTATNTREEEQGDGDGAEQDEEEMGTYTVNVRGKPVPLKDITVTSPGGEEMGLDDYMKAMTPHPEPDDGEEEKKTEKRTRWTFKESRPRTVPTKGANVTAPTTPTGDSGLFSEVTDTKATVNTDYLRSIAEQLNKPGMNGAALHTREASRAYRGLAAEVVINALGGA